MEREQKRQRKGSSLACSRASWQLPSELLCLVFGFLSWRDYPSLSAVNKEWWAASQTPPVQQAMALAAEREEQRPTRRWQALGETEGEAPQPERFQCLTDCLWLSQEAMAALSLEEEDWEKAMDAWEEARDSAFPFFPGQHPYYCRLGGRDGHNGVGEVLVSKEEAILLEAGHMSGSGVWCSWNFYAAKEVIRSCAAAFSGCGRVYAAPGVVRCSYMELW